jgi:hypothetical protein
MDCDVLKEKLYECLKSKDLGFDKRYLKVAVKRHLDDVGLFKIDRRFLEECRYQEFSACLEEKFEMGKLDHRKLYSYYEGQFYKDKKKQENQSRLQNIVITGKSDDKIN